MKFKEFSWIFALVLLVSIPSAYAQTLGGKNIFFIIINALIFGIILFLLQSFLLPNKPDKEKTAMWFVIIIASLLLAWFFGSSGYLWQGPLAILFNLKILVNSILIAAFLYFLLGILKIPQLGSLEGKTGYTILLFLVSAIIAVKIGNNWIWSEPIIQELYKFLLDPNAGILRGKKLWVFIGSFALLSFFFAGFLLKGGVGNSNKISYLLAFVLATSLASQGASIKAVIQMAEIFFVVMFATSLKDTTQNIPGLNWGLAIFLVAWVSAAATATVPEYRGLLGNIACGSLINCEQIGGQVTIGGGTTWGIIKIAMLFVGLPLILLWVFGGIKEKKISGLGIGLVLLILLGVLIWTGKWGILKIGLILLIPLLLLGGLGYAMIKSEKRWKFKQIRQRYMRLIRNWWRKRLDEWLARSKLNKKAWAKDRLSPDLLPNLYRENILILFSLSNYLKRLYIWYVKFDQVKSARHICEQMENWITSLYLDFDRLEDEIYACRTGGTITSEEGQSIKVGLFEAIGNYCLTMNEIARFLSEYLAAIIAGMDTSDPRYFVFIDRATNYKKVLSDALEPIIKSNKYLEDRAKAYGNHMPIKAQKYLVLDQCNPYGNTAHEYKFVESGTILNDGTTVIGHKLEVNLYGQVLDDINKGKSTIRKVHPDEIKAGKMKDLSPPHEMMELISQDWEGFINNMRYGMFRYNSKAVRDYTSRLGQSKDDPNRLGKNDFMPIFRYGDKFTIDAEHENIINFAPGWKTRDNPAFDRRALVNTGALTYPGRVEYEHTWQDVYKNPKLDPNPGVSSRGMSFYIPALTIRAIEDIDEAANYLSRFLYDRGLSVETSKKAGTTMGTLKEGLREQQKSEEHP